MFSVVDVDIFHILDNNKDKYGEVFTMFMGRPMVILNSSEAIYEGFVKNADSLSNRPVGENTPVFVLSGGNNSKHIVYTV